MCQALWQDAGVLSLKIHNPCFKKLIDHISFYIFALKANANKIIINFLLFSLYIHLQPSQRIFNLFSATKSFQLKKKQGFPGGAVVKNPPANAGDTGSEPWSGKIPRAVEQLSPCTTTTEPEL